MEWPIAKNLTEEDVKTWKGLIEKFYPDVTVYTKKVGQLFDIFGKMGSENIPRMYSY